MAAELSQQYLWDALTPSGNPEMMPFWVAFRVAFRVAISTAPDPQGSGRVDILTHPYTTIACATGVVTGTAGRDSSRCRYHGNERTRQVALDCECD